jgi:hypothetical protein
MPSQRRNDPENRNREIKLMSEDAKASGQPNNALNSQDPAVNLQGLQQLVQKETGGQSNPILQGLSQPAQPGSPAIGDKQARRESRFQNLMNLAGQGFAGGPSAPPPVPAGGVSQPPQAPSPQEEPETADSFVQPAQEPSQPQVGVGAGPMITTQRQVSQTIKPERISQLQEQAIEKENELLDIRKAEAAEAYKIQQEQADNVARQGALMQERLDEISSRREEALGSLQQKMQEFDQMDIQNPWSRKSTGAKILAAVSIGLSGLANVVTGDTSGKNPALDIINQHLQQDIDLQKANLDKKKGEITALQQYGQQLRQLGVDEQGIRESMVAMGEKKLASQLQALQSQLGPDDARSPAIAALEAQISQQALDRETKIANQFATKAVETQQPLGALISKESKGRDLTDKQLDGLINNRLGISAMNKLTGIIKDPKFRAKIGPVAGRIGQLKAQFVGDEQAGVLAQEVRNAILQKLRETTGAQMTDAERKYIASTMPDIFENIDTFESKLGNVRDSFINNYNQRYDVMQAQGFNLKGLPEPSKVKSFRLDK